MFPSSPGLPWKLPRIIVGLVHWYMLHDGARSISGSWRTEQWVTRDYLEAHHFGKSACHIPFSDISLIGTLISSSGCWSELYVVQIQYEQHILYVYVSVWVMSIGKHVPYKTDLSVLRSNNLFLNFSVWRSNSFFS